MPKVGCSNMLHYLRRMLLPPVLYEAAMRRPFSPRSFDAHGLHFRRSTPADLARFERVAGNASVFRWAVVRHPWRRLVSGFRSKYEGECNFSRRCLRETFRVPVPDDASPLSFADFVEALSTQDADRMDPHFRPQHMLCQLHRVPYDFLADLARPEHMDALSRRMGMARTFTEVESEDAAQVFGAGYYGGRTHVVHNCSARTVRLAERLYGEDARLLGYSFAEARRACATLGRTSLA